MGEKKNERGPREGDVEAIVKEAIGDSVTPSALLNPNTVSRVRRFLGRKPVEGPFTTHLRREEQPHYLFHSTGGLVAPDAGIEADEGSLPFSDRSLIVPVVGMMTDQRFSFIFGYQDSRQVVSVEHADIVDLEYRDYKVRKEVDLQTTQQQLSFSMWTTDPHAAELSDAAAYVFEKSEADGEYQSYDFESGEYGAAREALERQLGGMQTITTEVDLDYVARTAVKGARFGAYRGPYSAGAGFILAAGYAIWSELSDQSDTVVTVDDIDPDQTAEVMLEWQRAGRASNKKSLELASAALGAAVAIDQQVSGRGVSAALAEMDVGWVARQLDAGESRDAGLRVASEVVDAYSSELATLFEEDFFRQLDQDE